MRLPSRRYLLQLFPPARIAMFLIGAIVLTFLSSLIPRPMYGPGEQTIRFGYPMPYLNLTLEPAANSAANSGVNTVPVVFISWWGSAIQVDWGLALLNLAFFLSAFMLFRVMFRPTRRTEVGGLEP
jgi:cytochrome c oxidase assembly factor CtaG